MEFLIDFDAIDSEEGVLVVGIDIESLSLWLSPPPPSSAGQSFLADQVIDYRNLTGQYCDSVKIIKVAGSPLNDSSSTLILSCITVYLQVSIDLSTSSLSLVREYTKFSNCDQVDKTKPVYAYKGDDI